MSGSVEFRLPDIGEGLHEAEVVSWLVAVGDTVERNQPFVEIMTDKSSVEMPAPVAGVVSRLGATEGEIIQVGDVLIVIEGGKPGSTPGAATASVASHSAPAERPTPAPSPSSPSPDPTPAAATTPGGAGTRRRPKASPSTRKLAATLGVDLGAVTGTGPGGRILAVDVEAAGAPVGGPTPPPTSSSQPAAATDRPPARSRGDAPAPSASSPSIPATAQWSVGVHPLRGIRRATARAMDRSWSTIPHINAMNEINAEHLLAMRAQLRQHQEPDGPNITPLVIALMAVARALRRHPVMNATLDLEAETVTVHERVNLGVAVATDHGLMVPVIGDADQLPVTALAAELERLTVAARAASITPADLAGGTYTVTNFGSQGTYTANPIIRPGETGITGLGSIAPRPIVVDGEVVARPTLPVVVCGDHRLVDGDVLSSFHNDICSSLLAPIGLLL